MFCPKCGAEVGENALFCRTCGARLNEAAPEEAKAVEATAAFVPSASTGDDVYIPGKALPVSAPVPAAPVPAASASEPLNRKQFLATEKCRKSRTCTIAGAAVAFAAEFLAARGETAIGAANFGTAIDLAIVVGLAVLALTQTKFSRLGSWLLIGYAAVYAAVNALFGNADKGIFLGVIFLIGGILTVIGTTKTERLWKKYSKEQNAEKNA